MDQLQRELHAEIAVGKHPNTCLVFEAESTYTAGRHTQAHDIVDESLPIIETDRAGSITWHGPGQLVCYPLVKLAAPVDVIKYIRDRKSTRLNSSHVAISYAVFCLKKKT